MTVPDADIVHNIAISARIRLPCDFTPFDKGAYASSTTYISGGAVRKAALKIKTQLLEHAATMLGVDGPDVLALEQRKVVAPDGRSVSLAEIALSSLHQENQHQSWPLPPT